MKLKDKTVAELQAMLAELRQEVYGIEDEITHLEWRKTELEDDLYDIEQELAKVPAPADPVDMDELELAADREYRRQREKLQVFKKAYPDTPIRDYWQVGR